MRKYLKKALGIFLIILGFLALITPCSPGSWLSLVGLELLGLRFLLEDKLPAFLKDNQKGIFRKLLKKNNGKNLMNKPNQSEKQNRIFFDIYQKKEIQHSV